MTRSTPTRNVSLAQRRVRQALAEWDASDLDRADAARELLQQAARELASAETALREGSRECGPEIYQALLDLKRDLATLTGLIDSCAAFHHGLLVRLGGAASAYDASGRAVPRKNPRPAIGVQG